MITNDLERFTNDYFELLTGPYAGINLTRINTKEEFKLKQIIDSIEPLNQSEIFSNLYQQKKLHLDIGFGGGFPLLPLAKLHHEVRHIGFEARNKKVKVVGEIAAKLNLSNVRTYHHRIEDVLIDLPCTCSFKAVGKVNDFLEKIRPYRTTIQVFFYKAKNFYEQEEEQLKKAQENWKIIEEKKIEIAGIDRYLIGFENKNFIESSNNFNQLVRLSELN